ncbi:XrtA/PEP-CTERM system exopolysaccharide export protein [Paraglaciecola arctica]|uniref:Polysaccharide export outer membrane protein n=1 Tax=Paraglaciecola arctica BSs20135 TaxID=493475 RepID=K6YPG7_9ALTE|nr:XrtA/PEP-CTERM system exopolysaccharide export protein [Paraglaciecola arctica]GAC18533.1 polysaccharide export outer membrane protein [Paraglaciecola arctica BSs20135]|tara:strand:- start:520 stop:1155 length:636 start_codon:yes stop_codon:yes gene_type:complete
MKIVRWTQLFLLSFGLIVMAGCSTNSSLLPGATTRPSLTTSIDDYKYLIGPGDNVNIFVWRNPEVSGSFTVRPDGMITTSLVEDLQVSGKTPTALARDVEKELSKYIRDPIVTVSVGRFSGPYSEQVRVIGEAASPQAISYQEDMSLLDLMVAVGGITEFANGDGSKLIRVVNGEQKEYTVHIDRLIKEGDISANVDILPGDILIIPEAWF